MGRMTPLVERLKEIYSAAMKKEFTWYDYYPNNLTGNGKEGVFTYFWFPKGEKWDFLKYFVKYQSEVYENGAMVYGEPPKYFILLEYRQTYDRPLIVPDPVDFDPGVFCEPPEGYFDHYIVNEPGRFRYVFDSEEAAKGIVWRELLHIIYPYTHILNDEEASEWNSFLKETGHSDV